MMANQIEGLRKRTQESEKNHLQWVDHKSKGEFVFNVVMKILQAGIKQNNSYAMQEFGSEEEAIYQNNNLLREIIKTSERIIETAYKQNPALVIYSKDNKYPISWMINNVDVMTAFKRYPPLLPILNYIFKLTYKPKGIDREKMIENNKYSEVGKKYKSSSGKSWHYTTFITNKPFYTEMSKELDISIPTIKKYIKVLAKMGIFVKLAKVPVEKGRQGELIGTLYADGYFAQQKGNKFIKRAFLTREKHLKALKQPLDLNESK
jgi:hypothetical protein